jgi:hypothetical protein
MAEAKTSFGMGKGGRPALQTQGRRPSAWSIFLCCRRDVPPADIGYHRQRRDSTTAVTCRGCLAATESTVRTPLNGGGVRRPSRSCPGNSMADRRCKMLPNAMVAGIKGRSPLRVLAV